MAYYKLEFSQKASKEFDKLDHFTKKMIPSWINKYLVEVQDPRINGKALKGNQGEYWRYRIGDYRMLCQIIDNRLIVLVIEIGHRVEIYKHK